MSPSQRPGIPTPEGTEAGSAGGHPPAPPGIDAEGVTGWFTEHVAGACPPLAFEPVTGGRSNLTIEVRDAAGTRWVLRRPPLGHVLPTAHDMSREYRILAGLGPTAVPVPPVLGLCTDETVTGAPFYVMGFAEGVVVRTGEVAAGLGPDARMRAGVSLIDTLAALHAVDPDAVGLGDLGRREGYVARQLRRWHAQYQATRDEQGGPVVEDIDSAHDLLSAAIPAQQRSTVVHGDYRLDNCVVRPDGQVVAVLDWELCTLGDPLADLGQLLVYWVEPGERSPLPHAPTATPGFPARAALVGRYAEATGADLGTLDFYVAFACWRLACILEGVHARYLGGAMGDAFDTSSYPDTIRWLAARARTMAAGLDTGEGARS